MKNRVKNPVDDLSRYASGIIADRDQRMAITAPGMDLYAGVCHLALDTGIFGIIQDVQHGLGKLPRETIHAAGSFVFDDDLDPAAVKLAFNSEDGTPDGPMISNDCGSRSGMKKFLNRRCHRMYMIISCREHHAGPALLSQFLQVMINRILHA